MSGKMNAMRLNMALDTPHMQSGYNRCRCGLEHYADTSFEAVYATMARVKSVTTVM